MLFLFLTLVENENDKLDFDEIYRKYKSASFKRALRLLNNNYYDAEDAFQNAWIKISRNIGKMETHNEQAISTYVMTAIEYSAINIANSNRKWNKISETLELDPEEYVSDDLVCELCASERYENIVKTIEGMDKTYRDILLMFFVYEFTIKEIAETLELNVKTVWSRFYRGKYILTEKLKEEGFADEQRQ